MGQQKARLNTLNFFVFRTFALLSLRFFQRNKEIFNLYVSETRAELNIFVFGKNNQLALFQKSCE